MKVITRVYICSIRFPFYCIIRLCFQFHLVSLFVFQFSFYSFQYCFECFLLLKNCLILFVLVSCLRSQRQDIFQLSEVFCSHLVLVFSLLLLTVLTLVVITSSKTTEHLYMLIVVFRLPDRFSCFSRLFYGCCCVVRCMLSFYFSGTVSHTQKAFFLLLLAFVLSQLCSGQGSCFSPEREKNLKSALWMTPSFKGKVRG